MLIRKYVILGFLISGLLGMTFAGGASASGRLNQASATVAEHIDLIADTGGALGQMAVVNHPGEYNLAYVAVGPRVEVLDLSGRIAVVVFRSEILSGVVGKIVIQGNLAYIAAGSELYIFRIQIRHNPLQVTLVQTGSYLTDWSVVSQPPFILTDFVVAGNFAYALLSRGTVFGAGDHYLEIINISDPAQPTLTGEIKNSGPAKALALSDTRIYIAGNFDLTVIDVSDPTNPGELGQCSDCLSAPSAMVVADGQAYVLNFGSPKLRIFSLADPDHPILATSYEDGEHGSPTGIRIAYPYAYLSFSAGGLRVLNLTTNPLSEVGYYDYSNDVHGIHYAGTGLVTDGNTAYIGVNYNSLYKVDTSHPEQRLTGSKIASFALTAPVSVKVVQEYAYVVDWRAGFYVVNITDKNNPQITGLWPIVNSLLDVDIKGNYAYLIRYSTLYIIDISAPASPRMVGHFRSLVGGFSHVTVAGDYAYVMADGRGMLTFNVSDPANPSPASPDPFKFGGNARTLSRAYIRGTTLYAASDYNLCRVSVADPANPTLLNTIDPPGFALDLDLSARPNEIEYAYVAAEGELDQWGDYSDGGMRILQLNDLSEVGYFPSTPQTKRVAKQVSADGYSAYVIEDESLGSATLPYFTNTLRITDLHDFRNLTAEGYYQLPSPPGFFTAREGYVYVPVSGYGLMLLRSVPHTSLTIAARAGGTLVSNYDNTTYTFRPETFTGTTRITHTFQADSKLPSTGNLNPIQHAGRIEAVDTVTQQAVEPDQAYELTIHYSDAELGSTAENTLGIYFWDGTQWLKESGSSVDTAANTVSATPDHFSLWAVLGENPQFSQKLYYPHVASDGTWETEICVINPDNQQTLHGVFTAYSNSGTISSRLENIILPPHGRRSVIVGSEFADPDQIGYIIFSADADTFVGYTKFYITDRYRVAVPALAQAEVNTGDIFISHIAATEEWWTGVSLLNTTQTAKTIEITFNNGVTESKTIAAGEHTAFRIRDLIDGRPQPEITSAIISHGAGIVGLELFGSNNQLSGILLKDDTATALYFPHLASDNGWWTGISAYNPQPNSSTLRITPFRVDGEALAKQTFVLDSHKKYLGNVTSLGLPDEAAWFMIEADAGVTGLELFGTSNGNLLAGYTGVGIASRKAVFPKLADDGWTGIAFANITSEPADIDLTFYNDAGVAVNQGQIQVGGHCKVSDIAENLLRVDTTGSTYDIGGATYMDYSSNRDVVGFQINGSSDNLLLDALPGL